jgi:hypothetical protein
LDALAGFFIEIVFVEIEFARTASGGGFTAVISVMAVAIGTPFSVSVRFPVAIGASFPVSVGLSVAIGASFPVSVRFPVAIGASFPVSVGLSVAIGASFSVSVGLSVAIRASFSVSVRPFAVMMGFVFIFSGAECRFFRSFFVCGDLFTRS